MYDSGTPSYTVTSSATATITAGTGTAFIYITGDGVLTVGHNLTVACSAGCLSLSGVASFPPDSIPVATWMKSDRRMRELSRDTLLSSRAFGRGYFRRQFIEDLFQRHEREDSTYYGDMLWAFLAVELWHRQKVDEPARVTG